jgi:hypothetical protein
MPDQMPAQECAWFLRLRVAVTCYAWLAIFEEISKFFWLQNISIMYGRTSFSQPEIASYPA